MRISSLQQELFNSNGEPVRTILPAIVDKKQVDVRVSSLITHPIKLTPFPKDANTLALITFLDFYKIDYCLLCDDQGGKVGSVNKYL